MQIMRGILLNIFKVATVMLVVAVAAALIFGPAQVDDHLNKVMPVAAQHAPSERAKELHASLLIVDLHADSLLWNRDLVSRNNRGQVDIPRLIEGNVALQAFTIVTKVPREMNIRSNSGETDDITALAMLGMWPPQTWNSLRERALYQCAKLDDAAARSGGRFTIIKSVENLDGYLKRRQANPSVTAGFLGVEGAHCLEGNLENVDVFFEHGIRMMAPSHFFDSDMGGSAHGFSKGGLTAKGKEMVQRMQAQNMIVDLAHASPAVISDTLAISSRPVVVSHTGVKGTCDNERNLTDKELIGIAKTGGVVGIGYWSTAVCGNDAAAIAKAIRYTADLVGVDHVALGSDFDGAVTTPFDTSQLILITDALIEQRFSDDEIRKVMGGNAMRVLRETLPNR